MALPCYQVDFEIDAYYSVKEDIELALGKTAKIIVKTTNQSITNKGSLFFEKDTLDLQVAETEARRIIANFIDYFMVLMNIENMASLKFNKAILLNAKNFTGKTKTDYAEILSSMAVTAPIEVEKVKLAAQLTIKQWTLSKKDNETINRSLYWLQKAAQAQGEEKFIYRWISLEALSGLVSATSPQAILNTLISSKLKIESARKIVKDNNETINVLSKAGLCDWKGLKDFSKELSEAISKGKDCKSIVAKALLCVYCVRNSLFHRGDMVELMTVANVFLRDLTNQLIVDTLSH
jgi:hypothetical protein